MHCCLVASLKKKKNNYKNLFLRYTGDGFFKIANIFFENTPKFKIRSVPMQVQNMDLVQPNVVVHTQQTNQELNPTAQIAKEAIGQSSSSTASCSLKDLSVTAQKEIEDKLQDVLERTGTFTLRLATNNKCFMTDEKKLSPQVVREKYQEIEKTDAQKYKEFADLAHNTSTIVKEKMKAQKAAILLKNFMQRLLQAMFVGRDSRPYFSTATLHGIPYRLSEAGNELKKIQTVTKEEVTKSLQINMGEESQEETSKKAIDLLYKLIELKEVAIAYDEALTNEDANIANFTYFNQKDELDTLKTQEEALREPIAERLKTLPAFEKEQLEACHQEIKKRLAEIDNLLKARQTKFAIKEEIKTAQTDFLDAEHKQIFDLLKASAVIKEKIWLNASTCKSLSEEQRNNLFYRRFKELKELSERQKSQTTLYESLLASSKEQIAMHSADCERLAIQTEAIFNQLEQAKKLIEARKWVFKEEPKAEPVAAPVSEPASSANRYWWLAGPKTFLDYFFSGSAKPAVAISSSSNPVQPSSEAREEETKEPEATPAQPPTTSNADQPQTEEKPQQ